MSKTYLSVWVSKRESWETRGEKPVGDPRIPLSSMGRVIHTREPKITQEFSSARLIIKAFTNS